MHRKAKLIWNLNWVEAMEGRGLKRGWLGKCEKITVSYSDNSHVIKTIAGIVSDCQNPLMYISSAIFSKQ